jgi:hypothetical protein
MAVTHDVPAPEPTGAVAPARGTAPVPRWRRDLRGRLDALWLRWLTLPPWAQVLLVFAATRVFAFVVVDRVARFQPESLWNPANPGYLDVVSLWDGDWYRRIAEGGYPSVLPTKAGVTQQNQWAFYPLFPALGRGVMDLTGAPWQVAATTVALAAGAGFVVVLRSLMAPLVGNRLALWTVVLVCCYPAAPVLQLAYTESLGLLGVVSALWCLQNRHYLLAVPVVLLVGVARPVAVPLAAVVGLHVLRALWRHRTEPVPGRRIAAMLAATAAAGVAAIMWPVIAWFGTGQRDAYTDTMAAWRVGHEVHLFTPWLNISRYVLGYWVGPLVVVLVVAALAAWVLAPSSRLVGFDLRVWVLAYVGYLLAVLDPFTSLARYLIFLFPLGALLASASPSGAYRRALALAFLAGQVVWVAWLWRFVPPADWPP